MVCGRPARGVLAALKETLTLTGEQVFPSTLAESTKSYLEKSQEDFQKIKLWVEKCRLDLPKGNGKDPGATFQVCDRLHWRCIRLFYDVEWTSATYGWRAADNARSGFKLRLSKCKFAQRQIKLLGQIEGNVTRQLDPEKDRAVWKSNLWRHRMRYNNSSVSFHTTEYSFRTCQNYRISRNSQKQKKNKDLKLNWRRSKTGRRHWRRQLVLTTPVFDGKTPFMIQADSSAHSVGACLAQEQQMERSDH